MKPKFFAVSLWFRLRGYGVSIHNDRPLFSERNGHRKTVRIFGVAFQWLKP